MHPFNSCATVGVVVATMILGIADDPAQTEIPTSPATVTEAVDTANGSGNAIVIESDGPGDSVTVLRNSRNGTRNRLVIIRNGKMLVDEPSVVTENTPLRLQSGRRRLLSSLTTARDATRELPPADAVNQSQDEATSTTQTRKALVNDPLMKTVLPPRTLKILKALNDREE